MIFGRYKTVLTLSMSIFLIASNLSSIKVLEFNEHIRLTAGFFTYPFVFLFAAVIIGTSTKKEYFRSVSMSYASYLLFISLMIITANIDGIESQKQMNESLKDIFNIGNYRVFFASLISYSVSMISFFYLYKYVTGSTYKKTTISTLLCSAIDVNLFIFLSFLWEIGYYELIKLLFSATVKKIVSQLILIPPTVYLIGLIKNENHNSNK